MTIGIDGMISGLDTTAIVESLVAIQANQQVLLKQKSSAASSLVSALQGLNARVSSLATAAEKVTDPAAWDVTKASVSAESVSLSASPDAKPGVLEFAVDRLATSQVSVIDAADLAGGTFSIIVGGESHDITASSDHIDDIAAAINDVRGATGVSATKLRTGTDAEGNATYSLQLTGATGAANSFTVADASGQAVTMTALAQAQDAAITLWPSSGSGYQLTSATNTFEGVLDGVSLTVGEVSTEPVTLTVETDADARKALVSELVSNMSVVLSEIASRSRTTTSTGSGGNTVVTGGLFSGDSAIRFLTSDLQAAMTNPVDGRSPSAIGISIDRNGAISLDESALAAALAEDPERVMTMAQTIAGRVEEVATRASDPSDGTLTTKITSQESVIRDLGDQIARWDTRLEARRSQLIAQFTAMEVRLAQLQGTQSWLTNQIAGLNSLNASKE